MTDLLANTYAANATTPSNTSVVFNQSISFPDRPECFQIQNGYVLDPECRPISSSMLDFLNITDPQSYFDAYCLNPPDDSCAFGFCPNPDIAGPAVRYSTYVTNICLAILVWYQPEDAKDSFYAQILTVYSLVISAIISIGTHDLTKLHALFATIAAASPLSIYLFVYAIRATFGHRTRLHSIFGTEKWINRVITLVIVPIWLALLVFLALPTESYRFKQSACELSGSEHFVTLLLLGPVLAVFLEAGSSPILALYLVLTILPFVVWVGAIILRRHEIWNDSKKFPFGRMWTVVMVQYPFIEFCLVLFLPHLYWLLSLEVGSEFAMEPFEADYGQLLAIFVAVPPVISLLALFPRLWRWFTDLTWVRFIRNGGPKYQRTPDSDPSTAGWTHRFRFNGDDDKKYRASLAEGGWRAKKTLGRQDTTATFLIPLRDPEPRDYEMFNTYAVDIAAPPAGSDDDTLRNAGSHYGAFSAKLEPNRGSPS